jgi:hypothetical protein
MDGRFPTTIDYDYKSSIKGADSVRIAWNDTFWQESGWNNTAGVVVVVGVRMLEPGNFTIVLTNQTRTEDSLPINLIKVGESVEVTLPQIVEEGNRTYSHLF